MSKLTELKKDLADIKEAMTIAEKEGDKESMATFKTTIDKIQANIKEAEKEEKPEKPEAEKKPKAEKKEKTKKAKGKRGRPAKSKEEKKAKREEKKSKGKSKKICVETKKPIEKMTCKEIKEASRKRTELRKLNPRKKTKPVFERITDKVESAVTAAIYYNKQKKELNVKEVKKAIDSFVEAMEDLKDSLAGTFSNVRIKMFKKDLYAILDKLEKKEKESK